SRYPEKVRQNTADAWLRAARTMGHVFNVPSSRGTLKTCPTICGWGSVHHQQLARRGVNSDQERLGQVGGGDDGLARRQARQARPQAIVDAGDGLLQSGDDARIGQPMENERVDERQDLARQVVRQLRDECQSEPAFAAALGQASDLLEQYLGLV